MPALLNLPSSLTATQVPQIVDALLAASLAAGASDLHLVPTQNSLQVHWRKDGLLQNLVELPNAIKSNVVARLKVLAELLTYQTDLPQEGRIRKTEAMAELRVSTFPTLFGEKAVVRIFRSRGELQSIAHLGFPDDVQEELTALLRERGGVGLITGPAGSGKTTTAYACLRDIVRQGSRSIATLEDPIESLLDGVSQSQIRQVAGFTYELALRSLLRQDPDVIFVGEIRDAATAQLVFQAALTGHLVITTFHAGSVAEAVVRLMELQVEPYQLRTAIRLVLNLRLLRRRCGCQSGCDECHRTGYRDRFPLTEYATGEFIQKLTTGDLKSDQTGWEQAARQWGIRTRWDAARDAIQSNRTDFEEVRRVLGFGECCP